MDSNRRHFKKNNEIAYFCDGPSVELFCATLHNSIYVISFYFQQQLILSHRLLVLISKVPWPFKVTFQGPCQKGVRNLKQPVFFFFFFSSLFGERGCNGSRRGSEELVMFVLLVRFPKCLGQLSVLSTCSSMKEVNIESFVNLSVRNDRLAKKKSQV